MNVIDDLNQVKEKWFFMEEGGKIQFKTISRPEFLEIEKLTIKKKVDFKKVEGTPARIEYDQIDNDLRNELFWDASIRSWDEFCFRHPETKELIQCTPETCTRENKKLLMVCSKKFSSFAAESIKILNEEEAKQTEEEKKT